jgi:phosphoribosylformimino-5-aminoimidazole carboxamide ribotide isomerase
MLTIIPAIDLIDGKCVRLSKGDYSQKIIYNENPLEVAKSFEDHGLHRLHLVDLDGAKAQHVVNWKVLEKIASKTSLIIDFGGGIKSDDDIDLVFKCGAVMATVGSIAVKNRELFFKWLKQFGSDKIILGADVSNKKIAVSGWLEVTDLDIFKFLEDYLENGAKQILCTDISKDGMLEGTSLDLYKDILDHFPKIDLIASGGVKIIDDLNKLHELGVKSVVIGKAIYEGKILLSDLKKFVT